MILCVVDDLLFSVKISTAAKALGVDVYFERKVEDVVARVREKRPHLVIFDLNSGKLRPMEAIAAIKDDPELRGIRTLGYVSHVQTETIDAARKAGVDQVLARSAFAERLGDILTAGPENADGPAGPENADGPAGPENADGPAGPENADGPAGPENRTRPTDR